MRHLTCYAHPEGHTLFFDAAQQSHDAFRFTPYLDSKRNRHWTLDILTGGYRPDKKRDELTSTEFNLPGLAFTGFQRLRAFAAPERSSSQTLNWLADAVPRAYRSAESGVLDLDCEACEVTEALARFYRRAAGHLDTWPVSTPLPVALSLLVGAPAPSRYDYLQ